MVSRTTENNGEIGQNRMAQASAALGAARAVSLGLAQERRQIPRVSSGARSLVGQIFMWPISDREVARRTANSDNPLDVGVAAYHLVERLEIGGIIISEEVLGEVWLSVRDSTLGGFLDVTRLVHVRVRFDELEPEVVEQFASQLVDFCEDRATAVQADSMVLSSAEPGLLESLAQRGYLDNVVMSQHEGHQTYHANHSMRSA
jgi:hypothetical protein